MLHCSATALYAVRCDPRCATPRARVLPVQKYTYTQPRGGHRTERKFVAVRRNVILRLVLLLYGPVRLCQRVSWRRVHDIVRACVCVCRANCASVKGAGEPQTAVSGAPIRGRNALGGLTPVGPQYRCVIYRIAKTAQPPPAL